ncbi:MAG: MBL fold metallo-hydrolase [Capnocytophaga sp.]|nr:MBL fold metallo-hydrolase [Capnocytophaga sp.]
MLWIFAILIAALAVAAIVFTNQPQFGKLPSGERLERIKKSPNYKNGKFVNLSETPQLTADGSMASVLFEFVFGKKNPELNPKSVLPMVKTDLSKLDKNEDLLIWFGHSSYLLQADGIRFLVDPVFVSGSPLTFLNKAFETTEKYRPEDMPEVDFLIISHDHWDHLDYETIKVLKDKIQHIVTGLGVGEHFEHWGFDKNKITELDWNDQATFGNLTITSLPARHFSGRGFKNAQSLWSSFMLEMPSQTIYIGGDSGYDTHFADIGKRFPNINLAIIENGQYDKDWKYIHTMPEYLEQAAQDLNAQKILTVHHSKFPLAKHSWKEPLDNALKIREKGVDVLIPMLGETVKYTDSTSVHTIWWKDLE